MKKGEQRAGDYVVTLHSDKKCFWCGRDLKAKTKALRYYNNGFSNYECYPQDDKCIESVKECMGVS
jgi:hypothetical protein